MKKLEANAEKVDYLTFFLPDLFHINSPQLSTKTIIVPRTLRIEDGGPLQLQDTPCLTVVRPNSQIIT